MKQKARKESTCSRSSQCKHNDSALKLEVVVGMTTSKSTLLAAGVAPFL